MTGYIMTIPSPTPDIGDSFNRADGALAGATPTGSRAWQISGAGTTVPGIADGALKALSGQGNRLAAVTVGRRNYDVRYRIAAANTGTIVPSVALQATDDGNHVALLHRLNAGLPQYVIARRRDNVVQDLLQTNVVPRAGDYVLMRVRGGNSFTLVVNGVVLGSAGVTGWEDKSLVGFSFNAMDTVSSFDDFQVFLR